MEVLFECSKCGEELSITSVAKESNTIIYKVNTTCLCSRDLRRVKDSIMRLIEGDEVTLAWFKTLS